MSDLTTDRTRQHALQRILAMTTKILREEKLIDSIEGLTIKRVSRYEWSLVSETT